jgi:hypothetical protein
MWNRPQFAKSLHDSAPTRVVTVSQAVRDHMLKDAAKFADRFTFVRGAIDVEPFLNAKERARCAQNKA